MFGKDEPHVCGTTNHKFEQFLVKSTPGTSNFKVSQASEAFILDYMDKLSTKEYVVRCKYCGQIAE